MGSLLLISDDVSRTGRLVRALGPDRRCTVHDLYGDTIPPSQPGLIVADVSQLTSEAILRFKRLLEPLRAAGVPFLFLAHGNAARAEALAGFLGAKEILPAVTGLSRLQDWIDHLQAQGVSPAATKLTGSARKFFIRAFHSGETITPELASVGSELVARAVEQAGIRDWIRAVQRFDEATHQHCLLVAGLSAAFATELGLRASDSHRLTKAALLHDVGKTQISPAILNKPGRLTDDELSVMRTHPVLGYDMLVGRGFSPEMLQVVRSHHEMLDGSGYPDGLRGPEIPDLVRLVTICDIYGALIERRSYHSPKLGREAYAILQAMNGQLDADLVRAFSSVMNAFDPAGRPNSEVLDI